MEKIIRSKKHIYFLGADKSFKRCEVVMSEEGGTAVSIGGFKSAVVSGT